MGMLCVALIVSLISVVWSAPLACESLVAPLVKTPDTISGEWFLVGLSTESCWLSIVLNLFFGGSVSYNLTPLNQLNTYEAVTNMKWMGYCINETEVISFVNNSFLDGGYVEGQGYPKGDPDLLIQTDCPDCLLVREHDSGYDYLVLLSRRQAVTAAELAEFKKQAECLGWSSPVVFNAEHDATCKAWDFDDDYEVEFTKNQSKKMLISFAERLRALSDNIYNCFSQTLKKLM